MEIKYRTELPKLLQFHNLPPIAAEVGVAEGLFSAELLRRGINLVMVDNWGTIEGITGDGNYPQEWHDNNLEQVRKLADKFPSRATIAQGLSTDVAATFGDEVFSLVYIDADHSYDGCMKDLQAWYPKVVKGGIIAGHDYLNNDYGVEVAVLEFCNERGIQIHLIPETKDEDASFWFIKP